MWEAKNDFPAKLSLWIKQIIKLFKIKPQIDIESELRINVIIYDINILAEIV